jgi:hypothetical protein
MNRIRTRLLKVAYRKEPISSFLLTVGVVDAVMGGVSARGSLLAVGLAIVGIAALLRGLRLRYRPISPIEPPPVRYLPAQSSRPSLPMLGLSETRE